jgi:hypothetical protein
MAAFMFVAEASSLDRPSDAVEPIMLEDDGIYFFLVRYFIHVHDLPIDLYGGGVIEGYQLHRLRQELEQAFQDVQCKPPSWQVLVGWKTEKKSVETEDWQTVEKKDVLAAITSLLALVRCAQTTDLKLVCSGD